MVLRNRLAHLEARNMREIQALLALLAKRIGFRLAPGISERVVFRELFMKGLTALDLPEARDGQREVGSHVAARRQRSAERRGGKGCVSKCRSRGSPAH